jgi:hypothetical protein
MIRLKAGDRSAVEIVNPIMTMRARGRPTTRRREALHQKPRTMRACKKCGNMNADHDTRNCGGASELPFSMNQSGTQPRARAKRQRIPPPSDLPPPVPSFSASAPRRGSRTRKPTAKAVRVEEETISSAAKRKPPKATGGQQKRSRRSRSSIPARTWNASKGEWE